MQFYAKKWGHVRMYVCMYVCMFFELSRGGKI